MTSQRILELVMDVLHYQSRCDISKRGSKKILDERYAAEYLKQVSYVERSRKAVSVYLPARAKTAPLFSLLIKKYLLRIQII